MIQAQPTKITLKADDIREYEDMLRVRSERQQLNSASSHHASYSTNDSFSQHDLQPTRSDIRAQRIGLVKK